MAECAETRPLPEGERLRRWIAKYKIVFEGPLASREWPAQYESIFRSIRDIDKIRFDEYGPNDHRGLLTVAQIKDRVANVNDVAYSCRRDRANEQTWRLKTEHWILWRFDAEVACHKCKKRLWTSEIQTLPQDPERADELRSRRAQRVLCSCSQSERAMVDRRDRGQTRVFADRAEDVVLHQDSMELLGCGVKERKPDRIFGLKNTTIFDQYVSAEENIRHSPFADGKVLYPFLIIEAKSEKGSPGFESIEAQTAFPIRSLLQMQQRLSKRSGIEIHPLLWFLANQGDEWRVYAAVVDKSQFRIFDLWHGTILSQDCALQLLLIIDAICEWARDIYRLDILRCLSGGDLNLRAITPAWSTSQSQSGVQEDSDESCSTPTTGTLTPPFEPLTISSPLAYPANEAAIPDIDMAMTDADSLNDEALTLPPDCGDRMRQWIQYDRRHPGSPIWTKLASVQHSDWVQFTFRYFAVPDELGALRQLLETANNSGDLAVSASETLSLFESQSTVQTDIKAIVRIAGLWAEDADFLLNGTQTSFDRPIQARVAFHTYFDMDSWQTVRLLECFTCSQKAWNLLLQVSRYENPPQRHQWMSDHRADLQAYVSPLRYLHGEKSVTAALLSLELQLCGSEAPEPAIGDLHWEESARFPVEDLFHREDRFGGLDALHGYARSLTVQREVRGTASDAPWLDSMLEGRGMKAEHRAILLRKPPTWPAACPFFCLSVFDSDLNLDDEGSVGQTLERVYEAGDIYVVSVGRDGPRTLGDADRHAILLWAKILEGNEPADTPWPALS